MSRLIASSDTENEKTKRLIFDIGGISVCFVNHQTGSCLTPAKAFEGFLSTGPAEVELEVRFGNFPAPYREIPDFIANNWSLYLVEQKQIIQLKHAPSESSNPFQTLILDPEKRRGELWAPEALLGNSAIIVPPVLLDELLAVSLLAHGAGILLHACGIKTISNLGLLFSGTSGAGKSTTARIWQRFAGTTLFSDERISVRKRAGKFWMYGTPWNSDGQSSEPGGAPLSDLFVIRHGSTNQARRLDPNEALAQLIAQVYLPYGDKQGLTFTFEFLEDLVQSVPCYQLGFAPDERVVDFVQRLVSSRS